MNPARISCEKRAATNHGAIDRSSAVADGLTKDEIAHLVRSGQWRRHLPGVYIPAAVPITWQTRLAAVRAWLGDDCLFSHRTAGALLGLDGVPSALVEAVCHRGRSAEGVILHRIGPFDRPRRLFVEGFPVTNTERTILDLFSVLTEGPASLAMEDGLRKRLTTIDRLWDVYSEHGRPGRNGARTFRRALLCRDHADGTLQSRMESLMRGLLRRLPGQQAVPQFPVDTEGGRFFLDFAYPDVKLGLEAHGIRWHLGNERAKQDLARDRWLKRWGWTTLYYAWDDLRFRPDEVAAEVLEVRDSLAARLF